MISTPTVLILGAGASADYKFPVGPEFKNKICALLDDTVFLSELEKKGVKRTVKFLETYCWSGISSPDRFLEGRPEFMKPGKFCIAKVLVGNEDARKLRPGHQGPSQSWYELLVNKVDLASDSYPNNKLTLISFNYDRSLEHYFWRRIKAVFSQREQIESAWNQRPKIIHVHGVLGSYDPLGGHSRPYTPDVSIESLEIAANGIRIIPEVNDQDTVFDAAEEALRQAARIYFLGFGFDGRNIGRLRVFRKPLAEGVAVAATRVGIEIREWRNIVARESWLKNARVSAQSIYYFLSEQVDL